jgi:hypothetical protein
MSFGYSAFPGWIFMFFLAITNNFPEHMASALKVQEILVQFHLLLIDLIMFCHIPVFSNLKKKLLVSQVMCVVLFLIDFKGVEYGTIYKPEHHFLWPLDCFS